MFHQPIIAAGMPKGGIGIDLLHRLGMEWGVEVLTPDGWRPVRRGLRRRLLRFGSHAEALDAAVREWRRTDRAARPYPLGPFSLD